MPSGLPAFIDECPDYAIRNGRMQISMGTFILLMPIDVFQAGCIRGSLAIEKWRAAKARPKAGTVLPFKKR